MKAEWQDSLAIGVVEVDIQHKLLFDKVNAFLGACVSGASLEDINKLLWFLEAYALTHFRDEERVMQEVVFPEFLSHRAQHLAFVKDIADLKQRLRKEGPTEELVSGAAGFITGWLHEHITKMDSAIGNYVRLSAAREEMLTAHWADKPAT